MDTEYWIGQDKDDLIIHNRTFNTKYPNINLNIIYNFKKIFVSIYVIDLIYIENLSYVQSVYLFIFRIHALQIYTGKWQTKLLTIYRQVSETVMK